MTTSMLLSDAQFKASTTQTGLRVLDFYAATFRSTPDSSGDQIAPGAFDEWLPEFYAKGDPLPISFSHAAIFGQTDPSNYIGYAPADPEHVWVDDFGLRMKAVIYADSVKGGQVARLIDDKVIRSASLALLVAKATKNADGSRVITKAGVLEAGPCLVGIDDQAVLLSLKASLEAEPWLTVDEFRELFLDLPPMETKAVDTSPWDGNRAMTMCSTAAEYDSICAAHHTTGQPGERQYYAGPHHFLGRGPNEGGVQAALGRWGTAYDNSQVQNITQPEWQSGLNHLRAHAKEINPDYTPPKAEVVEEVEALAEFTELVTKHAASPTYLQAAHDALIRAGAKCATPETPVAVGTKAEDVEVEHKADLDEDALLEGLRLIRAEALD